MEDETDAKGAFHEYEQAVNALLRGTTKDYRAARRGVPDPDFNGEAVVDILWKSIAKAWGTNHPPPTASNWKWRASSSHEPESGEVRLERLIVQRGKPEHWSYQMSTISGLPGRPAKRCAIDLVRNFWGGRFAFIELKLASDDPFAAAFELLRYFLAYLRAREHGATCGKGDPDVFGAKSIDLVVLAPIAFYVYPEKGEHMDVDWFACELTKGLKSKLPDGLVATFRFASFRSADEESRVQEIIEQFAEPQISS